MSPPGSTPRVERIQDFSQNIEEYVKSAFPERKNLTVFDIEKVRVGASHRIYSLTTRWQGSDGPVSGGLVIRVEPDVGLAPPYDIRREYEVLKRIRKAGVPVPEALCLEEDTTILGGPFIVMEKLEGGETLADAWREHPEHRARLMEDYTSLVARVHQLDWNAADLSFLGIPLDGRDYARREIARWEKVVAENQHISYPIMAELFSWLREEAPSAGRHALCHGDCTPHNAFVRDGRLVAMLDWEMASIGDPISDIGWTSFFSNFVGPAIGLSGWDESRFIGRYEELCGEEVDEKRLRFWRVLAYVKAAAIAIAAIKAGLESEDINMRLLVVFGMGMTAGQQDRAARMLGF